MLSVEKLVAKVSGSSMCSTHPSSLAKCRANCRGRTHILIFLQDIEAGDQIGGGVENCCSWALNYNSWLPLERGREGVGDVGIALCALRTLPGLRPYSARAEVVCTCALRHLES